MSQDKKIRVSLKDLSEEEKKQRKRDIHREYMYKRRLEDPEFAQKIRDNNNNRKGTYKYANTADKYDKEKRCEYNKNYYNNRKNKLKELEELKKQLEISNISLKIDSVSYF